MGEITLAEGVKLKRILNRRIIELEEEIQRVAFTTIEKGQTATPGPRILTQIVRETYRIKALEMEKQAHQLSNKINVVNYKIELDFDDKDYF